jgi:uncharacterized membrane protein YecN with MAPEG domain
MPPIVTSIYAALSAILLLVLAGRVVLQRRRSKIGLGDGGDSALQQCMRVHANAVEYLPLALILLLLLELRGIPAPWLHGLGISLVVGRVLHAWGFSRRKGVSFGRFVGTLVTWLVLLTMAAMLLVHALPGH